MTTQASYPYADTMQILPLLRRSGPRRLPWGRHRVYHDNACWIAAWRDRQAGRQDTDLTALQAQRRAAAGHAASRCLVTELGRTRTTGGGLDPAPFRRQVWLRRMMVRVRWNPGGTALV